jgi:hypothetical protein
MRYLQDKVAAAREGNERGGYKSLQLPSTQSESSLFSFFIFRSGLSDVWNNCIQISEGLLYHIYLHTGITLVHQLPIFKIKSVTEKRERS